jgi:hypothetical protein
MDPFVTGVDWRELGSVGFARKGIVKQSEREERVGLGLGWRMVG